MWEIYNPDMDINKTFPVIKEIKTEKDWSIDSTIDDINSRLELDNLKLELPKTKEQQEKEVLELVQVRWLKTSFEHNRFDGWVYINKIQDWVFALVPKDTWNVNYFIDDEWEIVFWIWSVNERPFVENWKAFEDAWYIQKKENWLFNMYKVLPNENWEDILEWPIYINSIEYYQAWLDIMFYADILNKYLWLKHNVESNKLDIRLFIKHWSFKYEDLEIHLDKWLITKDIFAYWVDELRKILVKQCNDQRLIWLTWFNWESLWIKESDLRIYLEKWYISQDLALKCYDVLLEEMKDLSK